MNLNKILALTLMALLTACASTQEKLSKAVPDASSAQRAEAAKEEERRKAVETNISKTPDWFLQNDNNPDAIYVTATEGAVDMQLSIDMAMLSANPPLGKYYNVKVYDGNSQLPGTVTYDNARTSWTFKPDRPLSGGLYKLTPKVATFDGGATGSASGTRTFTILLPLNDTGITSSQCYGAGSDDLISCTITTAINLYSKQDGMLGRDVSSPNDSDGKLGFSYSEVGNYPRTDCVKDNITGLMWEGKPDSGLRGGLNPNGTYTNFDTDDKINAIDNAQGYVNAVNAAGLCGYTDWRLPTVSELQSIVDYGVASPGPTIDGNWFPNTKAFYWTSSPYVGYSVSAWGVDFNYGYVYVSYLRYYDGNYVRLVR